LLWRNNTYRYKTTWKVVEQLWGFSNMTSSKVSQPLKQYWKKLMAFHKTQPRNLKHRYDSASVVE
jgi:hypothetical protein